MILKFSIIALAAACCATLHAQALPHKPQQAFTRPQQLVDIGERRLHLYCSGSGPVTVVFDAHSGGAGSSWYAVQPHVARKTRACVYDRAGMGFSDFAVRPYTSGHAVEDLHRLLGAAKIAPPYLLVGSSYGGANAQLYAYSHPGEVAGMVLVEPQHEDEIARQDKITGGKLREMLLMVEEMNRACLDQSEKGFVAGSELWQHCLGGDDPSRSKALAASELALRKKPQYWLAKIAEETGFEASGGQLRAARKPFGDMPLIVLSRTVSPYAIPGKPASAKNRAVEAENQAILGEIAALSSRGQLRKVPGAGHIVHETKPLAVVKAIEEVLAQVKR
jgi:pimeloyl-ACP methyl ester carboxylesterase